MISHPVLAPLSAAEREEFFKQCRLVPVKRGTVLLERGKLYSDYFIIARGMFRLEMPVHRDDGPLATVAIHGRHDFLGDPVPPGSKEYVSYSRVTAVLDSDVFAVPTEVLSKTVNGNVECMAQMFLHTRHHLTRARRRIASLLGGTTEEKAGLALLELATGPVTQDPDSLHVDRKVSQSLLAALMGMSREQVNRTLKLLEARGMLKRTTSGYEVAQDITPAEANWLPPYRKK